MLRICGNSWWKITMLELDDLPDGWAVKRLSDPAVATLNPKKSEINGLSTETEVTFVPMSAVDDSSGMTRGQKCAAWVK